jgi:hypothetical protein
MTRPFSRFLFAAVETLGLSWLASVVVPFAFTGAFQGRTAPERIVLGLLVASHTLFLGYRHRTWTITIGGLVGFLWFVMSVLIVAHT